MIEPRHSRQARLVEVGEAGQAHIQKTTARIASVGVRGRIAARYAAGAGVGELAVREAAIADAAREVDARVTTKVASSSALRGASLTIDDGPDWARDLDPAARAVAAGAHDALIVLCAALREQP